MNAVLLFIIILASTMQSICKKSYNQKSNNKGTYTFSALTTLAAATFFVLSSSGKLDFQIKLFPWSAGFAFAYGLATVFNLLAITCGSLALTSLVLSYSLILPTIFGILFLGEPVSPWLFAGILLLLLSLLFINLKTEKIKITLRWSVYVLISFIGNGFCSITQTLQQNKFNGSYKNEFMIIALLLVAITMIIMAFCTERKELSFCAQKGIVPGIICGAANGVVNLLVLILTTQMSVSVMFPVISAGSILGTAAISVLLYKESLSKNQILGVILGIGAIVLLSI